MAKEVKREIVLIDAKRRGLDGGVIVEEHGRQLGHWPMGMAEARERAREEWGPTAKIRRGR